MPIYIVWVLNTAVTKTRCVTVFGTSRDFLDLLDPVVSRNVMPRLRGRGRFEPRNHARSPPPSPIIIITQTQTHIHTRTHTCTRVPKATRSGRRRERRKTTCTRRALTPATGVIKISTTERKINGRAITMSGGNDVTMTSATDRKHHGRGSGTGARKTETAGRATRRGANAIQTTRKIRGRF